MTQRQHSKAARAAENIDHDEVARFDAIADEWWDPAGKLAPLHRLNPVRLSFIREHICAHFSRDYRSPLALEGLSIVDIGCGGGLLCEPLARLGAKMTGLDPAAESIAAARRHGAAQGLDIDYRTQRAEEIAGANETFDIVLNMEVVEHVPDVAAFLQSCGRLVRPGGLMLLSTINRTMKAYMLAIIGAEYILRWVPAGTHRWERFVTPDELTMALKGAGLTPVETCGMVYNPLTDEWKLSMDTDVNYIAAAARPA